MRTEPLFEEMNEEKIAALTAEGNVLVTANPGTGKTKLLAHRYAYLVSLGIAPKDILCLTFTRKAREEMDERIKALLHTCGAPFSSSDLHIHTFHSFALDYLDGEGIVSSNLLRHIIYAYVTEHEVFTYSDTYVAETLVPHIENVISYLKNFGIMPESLREEDICAHFPQDHKNAADMSAFLLHFINIFREYEAQKSRVGRDYTDLLLDIRKQLDTPLFRHVLIDELQDVNHVQAEVALKSAHTFFAVGDKKQAIFGFQGGSILNFELFRNASEFILSENFRSTNDILYYARDQFQSLTKQEGYAKELAGLASGTGARGDKPTLCTADNPALAIAALCKAHNKLTIIARTNKQLIELSRVLEAHGIDFSTTFYSSSQSAKENVIDYLRGIFLSDEPSIRRALFTPFSPVSIREAFGIKKTRTAEELLSHAQEFERLRQEIRTFEDVQHLFTRHIFPIAAAYGKEYFYACVSVQKACFEALRVIPAMTAEAFFSYITTADLITGESGEEKNIVLTTVHKAKGKQWDTVAYLPKKSGKKSSWIDAVTQAILTSKGVHAEEEFSEEDVRIDFVALTRAKKELFIVSEDLTRYSVGEYNKKDLEQEEQKSTETHESARRAFSLFVAGQEKEAKQLLSHDTSWLLEATKQQLSGITRLSYSKLTDNAWEFFERNVLQLGFIGKALDTGSVVHHAAEHILRKQEYTHDEEHRPYIKNVEQAIQEIQQNYPEVIAIEEQFTVAMQDIWDFGGDTVITGKIDAILRNDKEYLMIDWKTDRNTSKASTHRQQLALYRKAYCLANNIPEENMHVAIGFVGLREIINTGEITYEVDWSKIGGSALHTLGKKAHKVLEWIQQPERLLEEITQKEQENPLWQYVKEEWDKK